MNWPPFRLPDPPEGFEHEALAASTSVVYARGQWVVYLEVIFWDETRRFRIESYPSERKALLAADWIRRAAQRDLPHPPTGM
ncbi:MAG: AP2 domain-containing protein [Oscillochloridaceae bacterium umkhey_bin13]